jgi:hypothetical protein
VSERLHPEGAPGIADGFGRQLLGDSGYERMRQQEQADWEVKNRYKAAQASMIQAKSIFVTFIGLGLGLLAVAGSISMIAMAVK